MIYFSSDINMRIYLCMNVYTAYLSGGDWACDLSSVGTHHFAKGCDDIMGQGQAAIFC